MAILTSSQLTFVDITDQRQLSAYLTSNRTTVQIFDTDSSKYNPDWSENNLEIVPQIFLDQTNVSLSDTNLTIEWKRKDGNGAEAQLTSGETVQNKILKVNTNKLGATASDMLTYICNVSYKDQETNQTVNITTQLSYTLIRTASDARTCFISGPQVFKYDTNGALTSDDQIVLNGSVQHVTISKWQYYNPTISSYVDYPTTTDNTDISSSTLKVKPEHGIFDDGGVAKIKLVTSDTNVFDIITITKLYDGRKGENGTIGADAYTILLTNESYTFPGTTNAAKEDSVETDILVYQGATEKTFTIKSIDGKTAASGNTNTTGLSYEVSGSKITFTSADTLVESAGSIPIVITVTIDKTSVDFTKMFSWSVAHTGSGACSLSIATSSQVFKSSDGQSYSPGVISLTPIVQNLALSSCEWKYSTDGGITYNNVVDTIAGLSVDNNTKVLSVANTCTEFSATITSLVFKCINGDFYDTMTISKLTDGQSAAAAYTVILSNEVQNIPTNTSLKPLANTTYSCDIIVYEGAEQLIPTTTTVGDGKFKITLPSNPTGIALAQPTAGKITFSVTTANAIQASGQIELSIDICGKSTVTKSISYAASKQGSSGTTPVVFTIYAPNGTVFSNQSGSLTLATSAYYGTTTITSGATYQWAKYESGTWNNISGATASTYTVNGNDVTNIASYRCTMTYSSKSYVDVITLEDKSDPYISEMLTIGGTTFKNGQGGSFVYVKVRTNGREVDPLLGPLKTEKLQDSGYDKDSYYYYLNTLNGTITLYKHTGLGWEATTDTQSFTYTWHLMDKDGNADTFYNNDATRFGKVIYLSCNDINSIGTLQCDVEKIN